ncbi:MAG: AraC family transcriptional regulator [Salinisphaeraceae bacterium]|nr:AraC family transcriptional regulator [Salinisphaeraceae bacterium]
MQDITIAMPFVRLGLQGATQAGYDTDRLLKSAGIAPSLLCLPRARVPAQHFVELVRVLQREMADEAMGLLARPQKLGTFALITRALLQEPDLYQALTRYADYYNWFDNGLVTGVHESDGEIVVTLTRSHGHAVLNHYIIESAAMTLHRFLSWLCRSRIELNAVRLDYPEPRWSEEYHSLFFGSPVGFDAPVTELRFSERYATLKPQRTLASLNAYINRAPADMFRPLFTKLFSHQVRSRIIQQLQHGAGLPEMEQVAADLALHSQTLRRRLAGEETTYLRLRTQARRDYALWLLSNESGLSVAEVADRVGFTESSAFIRAFKGWSGMTPVAYRKL